MYTAPLTVSVGNHPVALAIASVAATSTWRTAEAGEGSGCQLEHPRGDQATILTTQATGNPTGVAQSIGLSPDNNKVLAVLNGFDFPGDVLATIDSVDEAITSTVSLETGTDTMGQLVSDGSLDDVWVTDGRAVGTSCRT